jgi:2'-hydroxyisoflavone reductase
MTHPAAPTRRDLLRQAAAGTALLAGAGLVGCSSSSSTSQPSKEQPTKEQPATKDSPEAKQGARRILILGGTGFVGPAMVEAAQARGHTLTLFNRGKTNPTLFPDVEKLQGDRDGKLQALEGRKWDAVIDTSGYVPRVVKMSADLLASAVDQYIFISTISVYAGFEKPNMDETGPLATIDDPKNEEVKKNYGALKALCEKTIEAAMPGRVLTVRPGLIVGPRDPTGRFTYWPTRVERGGEVLAPGSGTDPVQFIDVRDLAEWTIRMIESRGVGIFNALGPAGRLEISSMLDQVKAAIPSSDARFTWVSAEFLEKEGVHPWSDMPTWIPATGDHAGAATLAWLKSLDEAERAEVTKGAGLVAEREAGVLARWKARTAR